MRGGLKNDAWLASAMRHDVMILNGVSTSSVFMPIAVMNLLLSSEIECTDEVLHALAGLAVTHNLLGSYHSPAETMAGMSIGLRAMRLEDYYTTLSPVEADERAYVCMQRARQFVYHSPDSKPRCTIS